MLEHEADAALAGAARQCVLAVEADLAAVRPVEAGDDAQQRRLAGARRAEQRQQLAVCDLQIDAVERRETGRTAWRCCWTSMLIGSSSRPAALSSEARRSSTVFSDQRHEGQQRQQRGHGERRRRS